MPHSVKRSCLCLLSSERKAGHHTRLSTHLCACWGQERRGEHTACLLCVSCAGDTPGLSTGREGSREDDCVSCSAHVRLLVGTTACNEPSASAWVRGGQSPASPGSPPTIVGIEACAPLSPLALSHMVGLVQVLGVRARPLSLLLALVTFRGHHTCGRDGASSWGSTPEILVQYPRQARSQLLTAW